ncbi:neural cell adhesion molecule 1 [Cheilinus undulatus]|uniref:neural cell adhesion molecule 1 n=1 Tax=Cheilinus undulatus TaxID=241271 RepID=UPI001BD2F408|nr:neural cell adhesion molecule 1 [Cheilinus undulatus]
MMNQSALVLRMASLLLLLVYGTEAAMQIITSEDDVLVGTPIFLLCKAGGEGDITWQKDGEDINEEMVSKVDETASKLFIKKATLKDSGKYTCHCDFDNGHTDNTHKILYIYEGPSFGGTTTYHEFLEGTEGKVPCLVTGKPAVDVHWLRDGREISANAGGQVRQLPDNTLLIKNVTRGDAGTYTCKAQIKGRTVSKELTISVVVNIHPTVFLREEVKKVMAGPETNVTLRCSVSGHPRPNVTWTMPTIFDSSHHHFESENTILTITSVTRADYGEYVCTAKNKISENSATTILHVYEAPEVSVSAEWQSVSMGERVSVSCNVSGHPQPELHWLNKHNGQTLDSSSGRVQVVDGVLTINDVVPSDGGLYSCMAVSTSGNASRDIAITTQPGPPLYLSVAPGPTSVFFFLKTPPISGGAPITNYVLQWRQSAAEQWKEIVTAPTLDPLAITSLKPYTLYTVRLAAMNAVGLGQFSDSNTVRTHGIQGEPDCPVVSTGAMKILSNSFSIPLKQTDDGGTPLQHFNIRYKQNKEGSEWKEMQLSSSADSISLQGLSFSSDYQMEVTAVNANGSSIPATFNFTIGPQPANSRSMTKGSVVAIVMVIFLVLFLVVDASCCYINRCGLLMSIAVKLFGQKVPGLRMLEDGEGNTNGEVKLKGISTPTGSLQRTGVQTITKDGGALTEVTCDKAPLTKHEKIQPRKDLPHADN